MPRTSAGLLMYRLQNGELQVLLGHPGGPYFQHNDDDAWTIPKGECRRGEDLLVTAQREFEEETGIQPQPPFIQLRPVKQKSGKLVHAWAFAGDCDPTAITSNLATMEWPPRSGQRIQFPELDRAEFFDIATARRKIKAAQAPMIEELVELLHRQ